MYDPFASPPPPGTYTIMGAPAPAPQQQGGPVRGRVPNALASLAGTAYAARNFPHGIPPSQIPYNTGVVPPGTPDSGVMPPIPAGAGGAPMGAAPGWAGLPADTLAMLPPEAQARISGLMNWHTAQRDWRATRPEHPVGGFGQDGRDARDAWRAQMEDWRGQKPGNWRTYTGS
jgi:hypothetical protein